MELCHKHYLLLLLLQNLLIVTVIARTQPLSYDKRNHSVTAVLVFGDSIVDPGNNNYIDTIAKGNFPPYGIDFPNQHPTERFSNGRLATDFIASYVGVKDFIPPYLDPTLSIRELMSGVSFASAGFDPLTPKLTKVIEIQKQVEYFEEYKKKVERAIGRENGESHKECLVYNKCRQ